MHCICVIGRKKTGKTTFTGEIIKSMKMPTFIYDVNREKIYRDIAQGGIRNLWTGGLDPDKFIENAFRLQNSCIVFEEAGYYLSDSRDKRLYNLMQRSRHVNNVVVMILHTISDLPPKIYGRLDYLCLFKTQDFSSSLDAKFRKNEQFMEAYNKVKNSENPHEYEFFAIL